MHLLVISLLLGGVYGHQVCHTANSCFGNTIVDSATNSASDIQCYGYNSCSEAVKIESLGSAFIHCYGSFSCYDAQLIQRPNTVTFARDINCMYSRIF